MIMRFVIVGAGIAGTTAAEELRKRSKDADIILIGEEDVPLYTRVLLPNYIEGKVERERLFLKKEMWYAENRIEWVSGTRVEKLDVKNKFVLLSDQRELPYDKLLIASGGEPKKMDAEPRGISYLRSLTDADHLVQLMREKGSHADVAIYGGGFIACEFLNIFTQVSLLFLHQS